MIMEFGKGKGKEIQDRISFSAKVPTAVVDSDGGGVVVTMMMLITKLECVHVCMYP